MRQRAIRRVAVIGTGTIGASWTANFLARGLEVHATDPAPEAEARLRRFVDTAWPVLARLAPLPGAPPHQLLIFCADPETAVAEADFVQENAPEREAVKQELLARIDAVLPPEIVIASSSSGLLISKLQAACRHAERVVIGHPFNPPHLIPLVEVVAGARTAPETVEQAMDFYRSIGKRPIHIRREVPGHVANRLQAALWREAVHLVATGVASVADIDAALAEGPGLRWALMGPHLTFHLAGGDGGMAQFLDQLGPPLESWWDDLGQPQLTPAIREALTAGVAAEAGGRDIASLAAERDDFLIELLALKNRPAAGRPVEEPALARRAAADAAGTAARGAGSPAARLQQLIHRRDKVLAVLHPPTAAHARIMERAGCEALFVGTGGVVGAYTGLADVGTATMSECLEIAGWIADSVNIPVIMDGDTGHGGIMAVRRMVKECIRRGIAGVRIDDQPIEGKRATQSAGVEVVPLEQAIARYRAAVEMKNELDPDFVVMAQCYARDAANGGLDDAIGRLKAYREAAGVDWVQLESPHSVDEIRRARAAVDGPFSFMKGKLGRYLGLDEHLALGVTIAWYPGFTHQVTWAALWDFMSAFRERGTAAWDAFVASRQDRPYPVPEMPDDGEGAAKQRRLEERYLPETARDKYGSE